MKLSNIKYIAVSMLLSFTATSCEDFLERPTEDDYVESNFYQNDEQCIQGVNGLYNSPWYDFQRGFIKVGEIMSGNEYMGDSPYLTFTVNSTDEDLVNMSYSLWAAVGRCNVVYNRLKTATCSEAVRNQTMGECLAWKAFAYFFLVRSFGDVPIVHDNTEELSSGEYATQPKIQKADVYEYIVLTLEKAMELLKDVKTPGNGRIDYYAAEALLAKVYLTKSGVNAGGNGQRDAGDLQMAAKLAKDVIDNSGRTLLPNYSDNFRLTYNKNVESLISWQWYTGRDPWTQQNTQQSDLAMVGFDELGDCWGQWRGPSVDLQEAFGVSALEDPAGRFDTDLRRKATMMLPGDFYDYFWTDKTADNGKKGFNYIQFLYDTDYGKGGPGSGPGSGTCPTGANHVKHLYGDVYDHEQALNVTPQIMAYGLATHILRLSDLYLVYAEAVIGNNTSTTDASAIDAFYAVRGRSVPAASRPASITWNDVWKERRLELAMEGDRWYDFVRRSYYDLQGAINELKSQHRNEYQNLNDAYKNYYESKYTNWNIGNAKYNNDASLIPNVTAASFSLPFPQEDVVFNKNLLNDPVHVDIRATYSY